MSGASSIVGRAAAEVRTLAAFTRMNLRVVFADPRTFWMHAGLMALNNVLFMSIWFVFFGRMNSIGGYALRDLMTLQGMVLVAFGAFVVFLGGGRDMARRVTDGTVDTYLARPKSVVLQALGSKSLASGWGDMATGALLIAWGCAGRGPAAALCAVLGVVSATVGLAAASVAYGSLAYWWRGADSLMRQVFDFLLTFSLWPGTMFGGWLRVALFTVLPAGIVAFVPYDAFRHASPPRALGALGLAVALFAVATAIHSRGLRRYCG